MRKPQSRQRDAKESLRNSVRSAAADCCTTEPAAGSAAEDDDRQQRAGHLPQWVNPIQPSTAAAKIQIAMMTIAAILLRGRCPASIALARFSVMTSVGINDTTSQMPSGTMIKSSKYPITGMKSGMRSIGDSAYPATAIARILAYQGTRGSRAAR